jgi:hypothetical protein
VTLFSLATPQQGQNMFLPPMPPPADGAGIVLDLNTPPAPFSSSEAVDALPEARLSSSTPNGTPRKTGRKERGHHSVLLGLLDRASSRAQS